MGQVKEEFWRAEWVTAVNREAADNLANAASQGDGGHPLVHL